MLGRRKIKRYKLRQRVAILKFNFALNGDELVIGKIIAIKTTGQGKNLTVWYAVRFDDGRIDELAHREVYAEFVEQETKEK